MFFPEVDSTNSYAINLLKNVKLAEGTVVHTARQTNGKGQRGSLWIAEHNSNVTASVILNPGFLNIENQFYLYIISALACYDTITDLLNSSQFDIKIKWPNDILLNRKKISGILIENTLQQQHLGWSVIGIGINVNQEVFEGNFEAVSLLLADGKKRYAEDVMKLFCMKLEKYYLELRQGKLADLRDNYLGRLFGYRQWLTFDVAGKYDVLRVDGISAEGLLLLEKKDGTRIQADVKDIRWVLND